MIPRQPSRTAFAAASYRAAHQLEGAKLFTDPLAVAIVGEDAAREGLEDAARGGMRLFVSARSRFAEEMLAGSLSRGVTQLVVLGAGLDTYAHRGVERTRLSIFEVDHPATQMWKRERLAAIAVTPGDNVRYAPVDFENETLGDGLRAAGFDAGARTFFTWLGVTPYLTRPAIEATLRFIAANAGGGEVVCDYGAPVESVPEEFRAAYLERAARVAALGEPFLSWFTPEAMRAELMAAGFARVNDVTLADIVARYWPDARPLRSPIARGHVVHAMTAG
jgi:methyltransferase (TIGR00027 family)